MKLLRLFNTIRFLKFEQIFFQIYYILKKKKFRKKTSRPSFTINAKKSDFLNIAKNNSCILQEGIFNFLNQEHSFKDIGWDSHRLDLLWNYNLHYFDYLHTSSVEDESSFQLKFVNDWIESGPKKTSIGWDSYPLSLRLVNWIKWSMKNNYTEKTFIDSIFDQTSFLEFRLERHILGNHLFANCKALIFSGIFLNGPDPERWLKKGLKLFERELNEQVLEDGGNFELSPMYHLVFLEDLLDIANILRAYEMNVSSSLQSLINKSIYKMINWINFLKHPDNSLVLFNDCAENIALSIEDIHTYALKLGFEANVDENNNLTYLEASGYIRYKNKDLVAFIDVAKIGPNYIPGHGHADLFSFEASFFGQRVFVNSGTSCYGISKRRIYERSTIAHNTLEIDNRSSSDVWSGFRVANRAYPRKPSIKYNNESQEAAISCSHNGYSKIFKKVIHNREWIFNKNSMEVIDYINGSFDTAISRLHIHPLISVQEYSKESISLKLNNGNLIYLMVENGSFFITNTKFSLGFGLLEANMCINIKIVDNSKCRLIINY